MPGRRAIPSRTPPKPRPGARSPVLSPRQVQRIVRAVIAGERREAMIQVTFLGPARMRQLNLRWKGHDRPTDVLAFAMREGDFGGLAGEVLGDVIISVPTARKQAEERGAHVHDEVTMLAAHGLLHLLGWDHDTPAKDRRMRAETDRLCRAAAPAT